MDNRPAPALSSTLSDALTGALDWWREAGVDHDYSDDPVRWAQPVQPVQPASPQPEEAPANAQATAQEPARAGKKAQEPSPPPAPAPKFDRGALPADLAGFTRWWLSEAALAEGPVTSRIAPRGQEGTKLMVIVPEPEREDRDSLLSGPQGKLLDAMLAAMELDDAHVYRASVLPRHLPGADWQAIGAAGIGDVLAHHVSLAKPERLAVFGANILPLIGNAPPQGPADLRIFNHEGSSIPLLACRSLAALLEQPRWKGRIWQSWLDWASQEPASHRG